MVRFCIQLIQGLQGEDWFYTIPMDRLGLRALHFEPDVKKLSFIFFVLWNYNCCLEQHEIYLHVFNTPCNAVSKNVSHLLG